jgi:hypothetical protein
MKAGLARLARQPDDVLTVFNHPACRDNFVTLMLF